MAANPILFKDYMNDNQNTEQPTNLIHQTLLKALQGFITTLVLEGADRKGTNDVNQPKAGELIIALQEFIASIVAGSQSRAHKTIEVSLVEEANEVRTNYNDNREDINMSSEEVPALDSTSSSELHVKGLIEGNPPEDQGALEKPQPTFHEKLLRALREHVFNTLPIRLLYFQSQGSSLQISLLERGVVHGRLESALRENFHEADHVPMVREFLAAMETEEEAIERLISRYARYAILSHTWLRTASGEVTYGDWDKRLLDPKDPGYRKLVNFCKTAWTDYRLALGWMDTVCINKESSAELDESIRSMYNWYHRAFVCIIYLAETGTISNMHMDPWFTRGWTLQELLAPEVIKFYSGDWKELVEYSHNDRIHAQITKQINRATTISEDELYDIHNTPISRRMQLAAKREVTREEDLAYSLMGIFDVSIATAYGEGADRAFFRLLQEILLSSEYVLDIFNWAGELPDSRPYNSFILPPSPQYYLQRSSNKNALLMRPMEPLTLTHLPGLRITVILMPAISISVPWIQYDAIGEYNATVNISPVGYYNYIPTTYNVLDKRSSGPDGQNKGDNWYQITLAVFSFDGNETNVCILKTCVAIGLRCYEPVGKVTALGDINNIETKEPIVFDLTKVNILKGSDSNEENANVDQSDDDDDHDSITDWNKETYYQIKRSELAKHGMQLVSLYL